jgi:hypothetical protein
MTDALRSDRPGEAPDRERDARIEELLLAGLDHYFSGQHELAINVWTRVLFLDRGHAKARAYIERARGALSEKQREGDELLHSGAAALSRGDRTAARQLLTSAVERGSSGDEALALLHRLDRLDAAATGMRAGQSKRAGDARQPQAGHPAPVRHDGRVAWAAAGIIAGVLVTAVAGAYLWIVADPLDVSASRTAIPIVPEEPLPVPAACEIRIARARALLAKGRLHEAASELDAGDPDGRHTAAMNELRAAIQLQLLAPHGTRSGTDEAGGTNGRAPEPPRANRP